MGTITATSKIKKMAWHLNTKMIEISARTESWHVWRPVIQCVLYVWILSRMWSCGSHMALPNGSEWCASWCLFVDLMRNAFSVWSHVISGEFMALTMRCLCLHEAHNLIAAACSEFQSVRKHYLELRLCEQDTDFLYVFQNISNTWMHVLYDFHHNTNHVFTEYTNSK